MARISITLILAAAAASMALVPVAAQAGTRAGDSAAVYTASASQPGTGRSSSGEKIVGGGNIFALILAALWVGGVVAAGVDAADDDDRNQSPGAN
jgi:hypothetical protein